MKHFRKVGVGLSLAAGLFASGCATGNARFTAHSLANQSQTVGTQGSTRGRSFEVAMHSDDGDRSNREARGIPTPQPVRDPASFGAHFPTPQPPLPAPDRVGYGSGGGHVSRFQ